MNQPELGRKITELRKAKGLTQEELVEKCNLSVRTLQRIESGEVTPRSYTIKIIFAALNYPVYDSSEDIINKSGETGFMISNRLGQFYRYVLDLFNLKTNTMKKISILLVTFSIAGIGLFLLCTESKAQKNEKAVKAIEDLQNKSNKWIKEGKIDSVLTLYREDANVIPSCSNKSEVRDMINSALDGGYKLIDFKNLSISVGDSIAVQKYYNVYEYQGATYKQMGMTEWRLTKGKWLIVNDIFMNY
ncbi:MAG TPA: helix-turn-helix transcriptional regulator [Bacteroidales bacterium]